MTPQASHRRDRLTGFAIVAFTLALSLLYTRNRIFWSDELFGWMLVTDPSGAHMLHAWRSGADGGGICFYLLARLWLAVFGHTATAFRLFSALGVALAAVLTFRLARRLFPWPIALFGVGLVWFSSDVVLWQIMQARFYGLLLAAVAAASFLFVLTAEALTPGLLLLTFLAHTLLVGTHPFGLVYSAAILLIMLATDALARRRRPRLYLATLSAWWILLPSIPALRSAAAVGKPHFWTSTPNLADLGNTFSCWSLLTGITLGVIAALSLALLAAGRLDRSMIRHSLTANRPTLLLSAGLLSVPLFIFLISQRGASFFVDRYLLPTVIPITLVLCQLLTWLLHSRAPSRRQPPRLASTLTVLTTALLTSAILWTALVQFPAHWTLPAPDANLGLLPLLPRDLPIVVEPVDLFDQLLAYHRAPGYDFVYLLDWENVTAPGSPRGEVSGFHEMEIWRNVGYFSGSVRDSGSFLAQTPVFFVIDNPGNLWFDRRVRPDPAFDVQHRGTFHRGPAPSDISDLWLVRRRATPSRHP